MTFCSSAGSGPANCAPLMGNRDDLLYANFGFAAGNQFRPRPACEFGFRPHLFGDAEFSQEGRGIGAARPVAIGK
jgi:hypothetical protein